MSFNKKQLTLIDEEELLRDYTSGKYPTNVIIQNPFRGTIEFIESESDKFQILINASYNSEFYSSEDIIRYNLNKHGDNLNIKLMTDVVESTIYRSTSYVNDNNPKYSDFLPLYLLITCISILVFLTFIFSVLFAYWWNKNKRPHITRPLQYKIDTDSTKHPLLISEPNTPHLLHNQMHGNFLSSKDQLNNPDLTTGNCQLINPMRYNSMVSCSAGIDTLTNQGNMGISDRMPFVLTGGFDDYPMDNVDLMNSINATGSLDNYFNQGPLMVSTNTTSMSYSTLPLNFNMAHSSRCNAGMDNTGHYLTYNPNQIRSSDTGKIPISTPNPSYGRHLAKDFLDENIIERIGMNFLSQISENDASHFNVEDMDAHNKQCPLDSMGMYQHLSRNTGQGSDETSGILSDSSGSTLDRPAQSSNAKITSGFSIVPSVINSGERFVSLDANDQRYIPLSDVIAEVANCPQHSYLIKAGQFPGVNVVQQIPIQQKSSCSPPALSVDWNIPTSSCGPPISVFHGVQVHGTPLDRKLSTGTLNKTSLYQPVIVSEDSIFYGDNMSKSVLINPPSGDQKPVIGGTFGRQNKNTPKPLRKDVIEKNVPLKEQQSLVEVSNADNYEIDDDIGDDDESGASTSPRSALKGSRHGPRVSKQLRFTTLGLLSLLTGIMMCSLSTVSGTNAPNSLSDITVINANYVIDTSIQNVTNNAVPQFSFDGNQFLHQIYQFIDLKLIIFIPSHLIDKNKSFPQSKIKSFQLYNNQSSNTMVKLGIFKRNSIDIYDMKNSLNILSQEVCRQRYSCSHSCDPGNGHRCTCQRGFALESDGKTCIDINECNSNSNICGRYGGTCVNIPGSYECICDGEICKDCNDRCPLGFFKKNSCAQSKHLQCSKCTSECSPGYYISRKCTETSNIQCTACRPLCITGEFELSPCSGTSNRICKPRLSISGIELPDKKNVWYEDRRNLRDIHHIISFDEAAKLSQDKELILERESGYQVRLKFISDITLQPIFEPVDHSEYNDNALFKINPSNYTLKYLCPFPMPPIYSLNMEMHYNVTTEVANDPFLPGYRPILQGCSTYIQHGEYPETDREINRNSQDSLWQSSYKQWTPSTVSCLDAGKLPSIFGETLNEQLAIREGVYVEEKHYCSKIKSDCQRCLVDCAHNMINNLLVCKPTDSPADNGRSPRLEICFDCCAKENCSSICDKYATQRCAMHLCMSGPRMDLQLSPDWPIGDTFICHVKPSSAKPIFSLRWYLYKDNKRLTLDEFTETMEFTEKPVSDQSSHKIKKVFKDLIHVTYSSNIHTLPDIISGSHDLQYAYIWNTERLPLSPGTASVKPGDKSASLKVWSYIPMGVNSGYWSQMSKHDCKKASEIVDKLNVYRKEVHPYRLLQDLKVERIAQYKYRLSNQRLASNINFTIPAKASLLSAIFTPTWVDREHFLTASLIYLGSDSSQTDNSLNGYWIVELIGQVNNFPGFFRLQLWSYDNKLMDSQPTLSDSYKVSRDNTSPLLDYDIGVYDEKNFKIHLRILAPESQPDYDKSFIIKIIDVKGELEIMVHRSKQDPQMMVQIEKYRRSQDGKYSDEEISILPEVMAVSREKSLKETSPFGIPPLVIYTVLAVLTICLLLLLVGHLTRKEEHLCEDIVFKSRHLVVFVIYLTLKALYCFSVTTTTLLIVIVIYTREPYTQLTNHNSEYTNSTVTEKLLMDKMDTYLEKELSRQLTHVTQIKSRCDKRLMKYYQNMNERLEYVSAQAAKRRSKVLISQAVVERAQYELRNMVNQLTRNLEDFNRTAKIFMKRIQHDMKMTKKKLSESEWLEGARLIYQEVLRKRTEGTISKDDPTKGFLAWLKITGELPESPPQLTLPSSFPFPDWAELNIPVPEPRVGNGLDAEYGPEYKPFNPKEKDLELEHSIWSYYDTPDDSSSKNNHESKYQPNPTVSKDSSNDEKSMLYTETIESVYRVLIQLSWCHLLTLTLLLDLLWLLHRAAHTIDTVEQIFYGYPCFIDCTIKGTRRKKRNENNFKFMLKRTFCETMESSFVPKFCGSAFALFIVYLLSTHLNELISEEALDFVGYYDNMALPTHLRNRFINTQIVQSAQQLNDYELGSYELFIHQRQSEIQDILNSWVDWTTQLEQYQCELLKQYKTDDSGKLISDILNKPDKVPIPTHCKLTPDERQKEIEKLIEFKMSVCPVSMIIPQLFTEYNETEVSLQIVKSSRHWLRWTRRWMDTVIHCLFGYISAIILWNTVGATVWFYVKRFSVIRQKRIYETDVQSIPLSTTESEMKSSALQ